MPYNNSPLVFLRHGATSWNLSGRYQGSVDTQLSPTGITHATENTNLIARLLKNQTLDPQKLSIVSSPLQRAQHTAQIISEGMQREHLVNGGNISSIVFNSAFRELSLGRWEGLTSLQVKQQFYQERKNRKSNRWGFRPHGGESMSGRETELKKNLHNLEPHTIIVTHAVVLRMIIHILGGLPKEQACQEHPQHVGLLVWDSAKLHRH